MVFCFVLFRFVSFRFVTLSYRFQKIAAYASSFECIGVGALSILQIDKLQNNIKHFEIYTMSLEAPLVENRV